MTKTDLFRVVIKIFGLYCFINALFQLLPSVSVTWGFDSFNFVFNLIYLLVMGLIAALFLSQTDRLIKLFKLEKGFDSTTIDVRNLNAHGLIKFGLVIIGLFMIVENLAPFINFCYWAFKKQVSANGLDEIGGSILDQYIDYNWWITSGLNILIGIVVTTNYKRISKLFVEKEKNIGDTN
ncbi:hypothetical protein [Flagellimonas sp.]|uniref:hypothetical protein n=1 Tax=Flagellimonas sp. TaxID=2058762 RepID=UPI003BACB6AB